MSDAIISEQANEELGRRVRSWKVAYLREVQNREAAEKELSSVRQVLVTMAEDAVVQIRRRYEPVQ